MRRILLTLLLLLIATVANAAPVIFYSDLTSGPKTGGQDNKGAFVTIWGKEFGAARGNSTVSVGGGLVDNYPEWSDTKICFQLGANVASGNIVVETANGNSNGIPFNVTSGNIYFVTPNGSGDGSYANPFSPHDYILKLESGEDGTIAYFRSGTYDGNYAYYGSGNNNFTLTNNHSGAPGLNNAFIGYPGEMALITTGGDASRGNFTGTYDEAMQSVYITISKLSLHSLFGSISAHTGWRIVGNDIEGLTDTTGHATGSISTGFYAQGTNHDIETTDVSILGNKIHGGRTGSKLDHAIYPSAGVDNIEIAYNHIYDNNFDAGPMVSLNCNYAWVDGLTSIGVSIHDNIIDMTQYSARAFAVWEVGPNSDIVFFNNIIHCGAETSLAMNTIYAVSGSLHYYNNTLYNCGDSNMAASWSFFEMTDHGHTYTPDSIEMRNNITHSKAEASYYVRVTGSFPDPIMSNNLFYGISSISGDDRYNTSGDSLVSDPQFIDSTNSDFHLQSTSPARNAGATISLVDHDFDGLVRPQGAAYDIGAYEYADGSSPTCDSSHLNLCTDQSSCQGADGNWCAEVCQSEPCGGGQDNKFYFSSSLGDDTNNCSEAAPCQTLDKANALTLSPGDQVLFNRGDIFRGQLRPQSGSPEGYITYGAYGTGDKPALLGSVDRSANTDWTDNTGNVWYTDGIVTDDVGNIIFDNGAQPCGVKKWNLTDLAAQGDYYWDTAASRLYLYSTSNPGDLYSSIECAVKNLYVINQQNRSYVVYDGLSIMYGGVHGIGGDNTHHIVIRNCNLSYIGGCFSSYDEDGNPKRYGNGIEFWNNAHDILVENNNISEIYDNAFTAQGTGPGDMYNIIFRNNIAWNCEITFSIWLRPATSRLRNVLVERNTLVNAGNGWSHNQRPDPRSTHLYFGWSPAAQGNITVRSNVLSGVAEYIMFANANDRPANAVRFNGNCWYDGTSPYIQVKSGTTISDIYENEFESRKGETGFEIKNSILAEPVFTDAANHDYSQPTSSPCYGAGAYAPAGSKKLGAAATIH